MDTLTIFCLCSLPFCFWVLMCVWKQDKKAREHNCELREKNKKLENEYSDLKFKINEKKRFGERIDIEEHRKLVSLKNEINDYYKSERWANEITH